MEKLMGQDKDKEITYQLLSQHNRLDLGKINLIYCYVKWIYMVTKTEIKIPSLLEFFSGVTSLLCS